jgi:photosystem II stability/assembly factor-like uncharacterized protein
MLIAAMLLTLPAVGFAGDDVLTRTDDLGHQACVRLFSPPMPPSGGELSTAVPDWRPLGPYGGDVDAVCASPTAAGVVLAGIAPDGSSGGTLYRSVDGGASWSEVSALSGLSVYDIEFAPDGAVYIGTDDGVWKSIDDGASWTQLPLGIGLNDQTMEIAIDPNNPNNVWAGVADALGNQDVNITRSTDAGASWVDVTPPMASPLTGMGIAFDPNDSNKVYTCFRGSFGGGAFWVSTDGGTTWTDRSLGLPSNPLNDIVHDGTRVLVTGGQLFGSQDVGLYESTDDGAHWTALHDGTWPIMAFSAIALDPNDYDTIYLASLGGGLYLSTDGGDNWTFNAGGTNGMSLNAVRFAPSSSTTIYAGASSIGVVISVDGGVSFNPSSVGIGALEVMAVGTNPNDVDEIAIAFQALNSGGVYTSLDGGQSWSLEPLPGTRWSNVVFHPNGTLYAISDGPSSIAPEGLYRRNVDGTWTCLGPDQGTYYESDVPAVRFSNNDPNLFLLGGSDFGVAGYEATVWRSLDAGDTWTKVYEGTLSSEAVTAIEIVEDGTDKVMVASFSAMGTPQEGGALRTTDGGDLWYDSSNGLDIESQGYDLAGSFSQLNTFYFADADYGTGNGGVYRTDDAGENWSLLASVGAVQRIIWDPLDANVFYIMQSSGAKVSRSDDGGLSFTAYDSGLGTAGWVRDLTYATGPAPRLLLATTTGVYARTLRDIGDMNCDGQVNNFDIAPFVQAVTNPANYAAQHPGCDIMLADVNGDGLVNNFDIGPFVGLLTK